MDAGATLVIIPTYNERENLPTFVDRVLSQPLSLEILIVDDASPDGTGQRADELAQRHSRVHTLHRAAKEGLGPAYLAGFRWALARPYSFIVEMDADFSHDPNDIPKLYEAIQEADLAIGSRYLNGIRVINWPLGRLLLSLCAAKYVRLITGMPLTDPTSGLKCLRREALESLDLEAIRSNGYSFQIEINHKLWRQGRRLTEVPIVFTDRFHGTSKMSPKIAREALGMVWRLYLQNAMRRSPRVRSQGIPEPQKDSQSSNETG